MPKFLIERNLPDVGSLSAEEMCGAAQNSRDVLHALGPGIQWVQSYVTANRITCLYIAPDEKLIREHAERAGLPADSIQQVQRVIDPTTAEGVPAAS